MHRVDGEYVNIGIFDRQSFGDEFVEGLGGAINRYIRDGIVAC